MLQNRVIATEQKGGSKTRRRSFAAGDAPGRGNQIAQPPLDPKRWRKSDKPGPLPREAPSCQDFLEGGVSEPPMREKQQRNYDFLHPPSNLTDTRGMSVNARSDTFGTTQTASDGRFAYGC